METDRELVERGRAGDERAFQELVDRYKELVYALDSSGGGRRPHTRGGAGAGGIPARLSRPAVFPWRSRVSTWIYRIVAHAFIDEAARQSAPVANGAGDRELAAPAGVRPTGEWRWSSEVEWRGRLEQAIARLPANSRLLIAAHGLAGVPSEDLGEALQLPPGTARRTAPREAAAAPAARDAST